MKKKHKRHIGRIMRVGIFLSILIACVLMLEGLFKPNRTQLPWNSSEKIKAFYKLKKNSLDVIFVGSSHAICTFNPYVFYKEGNIKSYVFANNEQPLWISYHYIIEALKHQAPKAIVLETFYISEAHTFKKEGVNRINLDDIKLSENKIDAIKVSDSITHLKFSSIFNYHDRWKTLEKNDFDIPKPEKLYGFTPLTRIDEKTIPSYDMKPSDLPEKSDRYLKEIIALCKKENVDLYLTYAPYNVNKSRLSHIETLKRIADSSKVPFLNFVDTTLLKEIGFDPKTDFEGGHTNLKGANTVSTYFAQYLKNKYGFDEERDFTGYEEMGQALRRYDSLMQKSLSEHQSK